MVMRSMGLDNRASAGEPDQFRQLRRPAGLKGNGYPH